MAFIQSTKQVGVLIKRIDAKKLRGDIQAACVNVIGHAMEHGSSPLVEQLVERFETAPMLKKLAPAVTQFLLKKGPFVYSKATGWQFSKAKKAAAVEEGYTFESFEADCGMWDDVVKATKPDEAFDVVKELERVIVKGERRSMDGKCIHADLLPRIGALIAQYTAAKALEAAQQTAKDFAAEIKAAEAETV